MIDMEKTIKRKVKYVDETFGRGMEELIAAWKGVKG
jgi:hypothetical protein